MTLTVLNFHYPWHGIVSPHFCLFSKCVYCDTTTASILRRNAAAVEHPRLLPWRESSSYWRRTKTTSAMSKSVLALWDLPACFRIYDTMMDENVGTVTAWVRRRCETTTTTIDCCTDIPLSLVLSVCMSFIHHKNPRSMASTTRFHSRQRYNTFSRYNSVCRKSRIRFRV